MLFPLILPNIKSVEEIMGLEDHGKKALRKDSFLCPPNRNRVVMEGCNPPVFCASPLGRTTFMKRDPWVTISHCLPITSAEIDLIRRPILKCRMNPPGVVKIHSWLTPQTADGKLRKMPSSFGRWTFPESTAPFNDDADTSANYQFRFAITFRSCYFTPRADSVIIPHHIDWEFITKEKCYLFFCRNRTIYSCTWHFQKLILVIVTLIVIQQVI